MLTIRSSSYLPPVVLVVPPSDEVRTNVRSPIHMLDADNVRPPPIPATEGSFFDGDDKSLEDNNLCDVFLKKQTMCIQTVVS